VEVVESAAASRLRGWGGEVVWSREAVTGAGSRTAPIAWGLVCCGVRPGGCCGGAGGGARGGLAG
jgi:hypothetical protein